MAQLTFTSPESGACSGIATDHDIALTTCELYDSADPNAYPVMNAAWAVNSDTLTLICLHGTSEEYARQ